MEKIFRVSNQEAAYPERLRSLKEMPGELYYRGRLPEDVPTVAIVGSRLCDYYGHMQAFEFGRILASYGVQIISGMAVGVDSYALEGALSAGGKTCAVLGSGPDVIYPPGNSCLYGEILKQGSIVSEYAPGTQPLKWNFPKRNRIISALSDVVLVIEAKMKSGSLITVDFALEQGRTVFALPGRVGDVLSDGCNYLISQGAGIAYSPEAILSELGLTDGSAYAGSRRGHREKTGNHLCGAAKAVYGKIPKDPVPLEEILKDSAYSIEETASALMELELSGLITEVSRNLYVRM